jgi:phospholipase/carboxylesterase
MTGLDQLPHALRPARGEPAGALVLMHGRGTSEHDLAPLFDLFDPDGRLVAAAPRAPLRLPPGGFHWYAVRQVGAPDPEGFTGSYAALEAWLAALAEETGVPRERTVLGGFSQGAVMSWALGAMRREDGPPPPRPAGILALSGFIPSVPGFAVDDATLAGLPVAIAHGRQDPVIGVEFGRAARARAEAAGADVLYRESDVPHTIDPHVIPELVDWLRARSPV